MVITGHPRIHCHQHKLSATFQGCRIDEVVNMDSPPVSLDQPDCLEHPKVLGHSGLAHAKNAGERIHAKGIGRTLAGQKLQKPQPCGVGKGTEYSGLLFRFFLDKLSRLHGPISSC